MTTKTSQSEAVKRLVDGYKNFHIKYFESGDTSLYQDLVKKGQAPKTMIIACSDSRVDPGIILNCSPGELFVVRNVANLVPPCEDDAKRHGTSAALEFAVCFLEVEHIIVLGHTHCGGIQALLNDSKEHMHGFIARWMEIAQDARAKALKEYTSRHEREQHCGEYSLMASLNNLYTFPWINERIAAGTLSLHAWYFDLETGDIRSYNTITKAFEKLI
jgi:carbonic anhydrase